MRRLEKHSESELVGLLRQGDDVAFEELYHRYLPLLIPFTKAYIHDDFLREEAIQEIFAKIWERRKKMDPGKSFKAYLFQAVKHKIFNLIRDKKPSVSIEQVGTHEMEWKENEDDEELITELGNKARHFLDDLPKVQKKVFISNRLEGKSSTEIAKNLNLSKRTIEHHLYLATKFLRKKIKKSLSTLSGWTILM